MANHVIQRVEGRIIVQPLVAVPLTALYDRLDTADEAISAEVAQRVADIAFLNAAKADKAEVATAISGEAAARVAGDAVEAGLRAAADTAETAARTTADAAEAAARVAADALKADKARTVTGGGLATGGGDLSVNRTITVAKASQAEAIAGTRDDVALTPVGLAAVVLHVSSATDVGLSAEAALRASGDATEAALRASADTAEADARIAADALKADKARTIFGAGLATGGGDLTGDRTITVPKASGAEALEGVNDEKAVTSLALKTARDADAVAVAAVDALKLDKAGDEMTGALNMGKNAVRMNPDTGATTPSSWSFPFLDGAGKALGFRANGSFEARGVMLRGNGDATVPSRFLFPFKDAMGRIRAGVLKNGGLFGQRLHLVAPTPDATNPARHVMAIWTRTATGLKRVLLGFDKAGRASLRLADDALRQLTEDTLATAWRGTGHAWNVRPGKIRNIASMQDADGYVYDAVQDRNPPSNNWGGAVALTASNKVRPILGYGQSNAGFGSGIGPATFDYSPYPQHVVALSSGVYGPFTDAGGGIFASFNDRLDIGPARHTQGYGISPTVQVGTAVIARNRAQPLRPEQVPIFVGTVWQGSTPANMFLPGAGDYLYENLISVATRARQGVARLGLTMEPGYINWTQGEAGPISGYAALFRTVIDTVRPGVQTALGASAQPHFLFDQTNQTSNGTATGVELDQAMVARERVGAGVTLACPMYQYPLLEQGAQDIHTSDVGRMMQAEVKAIAMAVVDAGGAFRPVGLSVTAVRTAAVIDLTYSNLPGDGQLRLDTDWMGAVGITVATKGFKASNGTDGSGLTINSVAIVGTNVVRITLSADPAVEVVIDYARDTSNQISMWAGGRGEVYVDSGEKSLTAATYGSALTPPVPTKVRHYAIRDRLMAGTDLNFSVALYALNGPYAATIPAGVTWSFSRASAALARNVAGVWSSFASGAARITDRGIRLGGARTNNLRNSVAAGGVVGTIGSGGALPTNWTILGSPPVPLDVVGTGVQNGLPYVDLRWHGTNSSGSTQYGSVNYETSTQVVAANGETWTSSLELAMVAGSMTGVNGGIINNAVNQWTSGGGYLANPAGGVLTPTSTPQRSIFTTTIANASVARVSSGLLFAILNGQSVDITLRIFSPQLEKAASAAAPIITSGSAVTVAADVATVVVPTGATAYRATYNAGTVTTGAVTAGASFDLVTGRPWEHGELQRLEFY